MDFDLREEDRVWLLSRVSDGRMTVAVGARRLE